MKYLLLLLALSLVTSDKLDRTYLPPPGAKLAGGSFGDLQTPLELLRDRYSEILPTYYTSKTLQGTNEYPVTFYAKKNPSFKYDKDFPETIPQTVQQNIKNSNANYFMNLIPNYQSNHHQLVGNKMAFAPKMATSHDIVPNYQPDAFGFYGGGPMIMTLRPSQPQQYPGKYQQIISMTEKENRGRDDISQKTSEPEYSNIDMNLSNIISSGALNNNAISPFTKTIAPKLFTIEKPLIYANLPLQTNSKTKTQARFKTKSKRPRDEFDRTATIIHYDNTITPEGFSYNFDTSNGIHADESGTAINGVRAKGSYSYTGDDGNVYSVTYTADENGFRPVGDHLPTPPPIPDAIKKVIEQTNRDRAAGIKPDDGSYDENKYGHKKYQGAMERLNYFNNNNVNDIRRTRINIMSQNNNRIIKPNTNRSYEKQVFDNSQERKAANENDVKFNPLPSGGQSNYNRKRPTLPKNMRKLNKYKQSSENQSKMIAGSHLFPDMMYELQNEKIVNVTFKNDNERISNVSESPSGAMNIDNAYVYVPPVPQENIQFFEILNKPSNKQHFYTTVNNKSDIKMPTNGENFVSNGDKTFSDNINNKSVLNSGMINMSSLGEAASVPNTLQQFQYDTVLLDQFFQTTTDIPKLEIIPNFIIPNSVFQPHTFKENIFDQSVKVDGFGRPIKVDNINQEYPDSSTFDNTRIFTTNTEYNQRPSEFFETHFTESTKSTNSAEGDFNKSNLKNPITGTTQFTHGEGFTEDRERNSVSKPQDTAISFQNSQQNDFPGQSSNQEAKPTLPNVNEDFAVVGEDFSGPKQAPHFDPVNGYYY